MKRQCFESQNQISHLIFFSSFRRVVPPLSLSPTAFSDDDESSAASVTPSHVEDVL